MSESFVNQLRTRQTLVIPAEARDIHVDSQRRVVIRVQLLDLWDAIRVETTLDTSVREVKEGALAALDPSADEPAEYVVKLGGFEVLEENASLAAAGVVSGSILSIGHRFRRAVR